jgi:hypothetical protein
MPFCLIVRLCVSMKELFAPELVFVEFVLNIFRISLGKMKQLLKCDKNNSYFTFKPMYIHDKMSLNYFKNKNIYRHIFSSVQNRCFMFSNVFLLMVKLVR